MPPILENLKILLLSLVELFQCLFWYFIPKPGSPFKSHLEPINIGSEIDKNRILKRAFKPDRIPGKIDTIVIGSGMSGLATAALLSRVGKRVLVLEQHDHAGGSTHTFEDSGFEFDVGLHYVGRLENKPLPFRTLVDQLTNGQVEWDAMDETFEEITLGDGKIYEMKAGEKYWENLEQQFPEELAVLEKYRKILNQMSSGRAWLIILKILPVWLTNLMDKSGFLNWFSLFHYGSLTTTQVLTDLGASKMLQASVGYAYLNSGCLPDNQSFMMHALNALHYKKGGFYPRGGSAEIAGAIIPTILESGGEVLVKANVNQILIDENGRAIGVSVQKGSQITNIFAQTIVSAAGVQNTFGKLLPNEITSNESRYTKYISNTGSGLAGVSVFVGLEGSEEELGLKSRNYWIFDSPSLTESMKRFCSLDFDDAVSSDIPVIFVSFPSTKDKCWSKTRPGKSTCIALTYGNYDWFASGDRPTARSKHRGDEYEQIKNEFGHVIWQQVLKRFPQLEGKESFFDVGSPVTNNFYISSTRGEFYGLDHSLSRFSAQAVSDLRPETDIPGLYLTGQDTFVCGLCGAAYSALLTASVILRRPGFFDLFWNAFKRRMAQRSEMGT